MFTPDDPSDTSTTSRGTLLDHRCVRLKATGLAQSYADWSGDGEYQVSEEDQVRFLAVHTAFKDVIEKHGPEIFLVDATEKVVYVEEIEGPSLRDFMYNLNWDSPEDVDAAKEVIHNALDIMSSIQRDGFCSPVGARGYVVRPDLTVAQVDFEEIVNLQPSTICDDKTTLYESVIDILRNVLTDDDDFEIGYDRADEILEELFYV